MEQHALEEKIKAHIKRVELSQAAVARKLHYTPDQFNKWLKGTNRIPDVAIQRFADFIDKRVGLTDQERRELFTLAGYVALDALRAKKIPAPTPAHLPPKTYHQLVGRQGEVTEVVNKLREPKQYKGLAIVGLGGMGKTALAHEVATYCQQEALFDCIVWRSAKTEHFESERIVARQGDALAFDEILSDIGRQCERPDIPQMPFEQKRAAVKWLLESRRILIVLDNLETAPDNETLVGALLLILGQSKLLLTSRHRIKHELVFPIELRGLSDQNGLDLLRLEGKMRNVSNVAAAPDAMLLEIHRTAGGAPLAMKLAVGQLSRQPMRVVLNALKKASRLGQDYEFYRFVYWYSWELLAETAQETLVDMSVFPPLTGGAAADVERVSQVEIEAFWRAMDQLVVMSLVDRIGELGEERYALHPLTHYFVLSDIVQEWQEDET